MIPPAAIQENDSAPPRVVLAIDPGTYDSAYVRFGGVIVEADIVPNDEIPQLIEARWAHLVAIEMVASYGMPVGKEVFETCVWIGRFMQVATDRGVPVRRVFRRDIKVHHCGSMKAKDSNIRQALIDKYGPPGTKKQPGLTYGLRKDMWQAFALAAYIKETECREVA